MTVIDLPGYLDTTPGGQLDPVMRPDGIHFELDTARKLAYDWLGDEVVRAAALPG
jgi:hypothetical protein